ncbi:hypothetical protein [Martelella soudanensis]|uniref:hypothetical protein n=1 Tax=Martelella sp. NC18 TaxID=2740297 RepID=UPI0015DD69D5|nr:hypothetical protein [Martelella sp. NC18]
MQRSVQRLCPAHGADLHHIHLADENRAAPSNGGRADYRAIISDLKALDFKGYLTMEIGFDHRSSDPDRFAREAFDYIKPLIGRP